MLYGKTRNPYNLNSKRILYWVYEQVPEILFFLIKYVGSGYEYVKKNVCRHFISSCGYMKSFWILQELFRVILCAKGMVVWHSFGPTTSLIFPGLRQVKNTKYWNVHSGKGAYFKLAFKWQSVRLFQDTIGAKIIEAGWHNNYLLLKSLS